MARSRSGSPRRYPRTARLNEVALEVLAEELERLDDPRLALVTLTGVDINADLSHATVYYSPLGGGVAERNEADAKATAKALATAAPHLRAVLGRQVRVKQVPALEFRPDPGIANGRRIDAILRELHGREQDGGSGESEDRA